MTTKLEPWNSPRWPTTTKPSPAMQELYKLLFKSEKFLNWKPDSPSLNPKFGATDEHLTPQQLADAWGVDVETIRNIFRDEPGVLKISNASKLRTTLRIPREVAERVHRRLAA